MPAIHSMLGLFGLATRRQFERAVDRKQRWHGLVRHVFVPYYLKFQETALGGMPELPARYSEDWVHDVERELEGFLQQDLEPVGELLGAAGFGTEKWERLQESGFTALERLLDRVAAEDGDDVAVSDEDIADAVREDVRDLLVRYPDLAMEVARRIDPDTGALVLTEDDVARVPAVRDLQTQLHTAHDELRRFRRGGQRALERIRDLEARLLFAPNGNGNGDAAQALPVVTPEDEAAREVAGLRKELRAREHRIAALRERVETLEREAQEHGAPDTALVARLEALQNELEARDAQVVRQQGRLEALEGELETRPDPAEADDVRQLRHDVRTREHEVEALREQLEALRAQAEREAAAGDEAGDPDELHQLRNDLAAREHTIEGLQQQLEAAQAEVEAAARRPAGDEAVDPDELHQLRNDLAAREHTIETLRQQLEAAAAEEDEDEGPAADDEEEVGDLRQLRNDLKAREHTIETLRAELDKAKRDAAAAGPRHTEADAPAAPAPAATERPREPGPDLEQETRIEELQRDVKARDHKIQALRDKLESFERELGQARERLVEQVRKLAALTEGEIEIKPADELDDMEAEQLLGYAREVAEDLDVRRQTLDQGLEGVESVKDSYEETRRVFEDQQREMETQLEQLRSEVDTYREQGESHPAETDSDMRETITKQRQQLELLSTRVRQLLATNKDLNESNEKIYASLEQAAKRVIPLRRQIEELETLQETLQRYIRQKFDRTFTIKKLQEAGLHR